MNERRTESESRPPGLEETLPSGPARANAHNARVVPSSGQTPLSPRLDAPLAAGEAVGEYVVDGLLGAGAFGTVYKATHPLIGKAVAIKVLSLRHSVDPAMVARFVEEARAVNRIEHPGIIDIFGFGRLDDGRQYFVMEQLRGRTLQQLLEAQGRLPLVDALALLTPIAEALDAAHGAGIAHRDLKPANIFVVEEGERRTKLLDFGVAKLLGDEGDATRRTESGATVGTPAYMSPEQCIGKGVDHRADIYALGIVAFQVITGRLPFEADSGFGMMAAHVSEPPPRARSLVSTLPQAVDDALAWMMAKDPADRPRSVGEGWARLRQIATATAEQPTVRRRAWIAAGVAAVGLAAVGGWIWLQLNATALNAALSAARLPDSALVPPPAMVPASTTPPSAAPPPAPATAPPTAAAPASEVAAAPSEARPDAAVGAPSDGQRVRVRTRPTEGKSRGANDLEPW